MNAIFPSYHLTFGTYIEIDIPPEAIRFITREIALIDIPFFSVLSYTGNPVFAELVDCLDRGSDTCVLDIPDLADATIYSDVEPLLDEVNNFFATVGDEYNGLELYLDEAGKFWDQIPAIRDAIIEDREVLYTLYNRINNTIYNISFANGISLTKLFDIGSSPEDFVQNKLLITIPKHEREALLVDYDFGNTIPQSLMLKGDDDVGYNVTMPKNPMIKLGYKLVKIEREDGTFIQPGESFELTKDGDTELLAAHFEPLTGKAHGGVIMKFDE